MSLRNVIILGSVLVSIVVAIVMYIIWIINVINDSKWHLTPWMIDEGVTGANILSFCSSNNVHCISDAILAFQNNNYNSSASVVYLSKDSGNTYSLEIFPIYNLQVYGVSNDGETIVGISQDLSGTNLTGLWMSFDGNTTWEQVSISQSRQVKLNMPYGIAMDKSATYFSACGNYNDGIWYSEDEGDTWHLSDAPIGSWLSVIMSTEVDESTGIPLLTSAMFSGSTTVPLPTATLPSVPVGDRLPPDIYYSENGGKNWTSSSTLSLLLEDTENENENVSLTNNKWKHNHASPSMGFAYQSISSDGKYQSVIVNTTVYLSSDYGESWEISETDEDITDWCSISVSNDGKTQALCSNTNGIYQSTDYGTKWTKDKEVISVDESNLQKLYGTPTYWINASVFDGGINACTYNFFYYKYTDTLSTRLYTAIISLCFLFVIILSCAFYFDWFTVSS